MGQLKIPLGATASAATVTAAVTAADASVTPASAPDAADASVTAAASVVPLNDQKRSASLNTI